MTSRSTTHVISRRQFLLRSAVVAGGLSLQLSTVTEAESSGADSSVALSAWLEIRPDNRVIITVPSPEIGNGVSTQHAMNIAEELECAWDQIEVRFADYQHERVHPGAFAAGLQPFFGGHSTDHERMPFAMQLGASARERLCAAAAARWQVERFNVQAEAGVLRNTLSGDECRFGDVAAAAAGIQLDQEPALKPASEWRLIGKASPPKLQIPAIATGQAIYGIDVQLPGMVYAALRQSPVHGGLLKSHQPEVVLGLPGVRAVIVIDPESTPGAPGSAQPTFGFDGSELRSGVAVIADHYWQALNALNALPMEWDDGLGAFWSSNEKLIARQNAVLDKWQGAALTKRGAGQLPDEKVSLEATYHTPFCEHATMEPLNGTAYYHEDRLELWHPAQDIQQAFWVAVDESGLPPEQVQFRQTLVGGGFGRRTSGDDVRAVVAIARHYPGVPVKVIWSREETTQQGAYRTAIASRFRAALGEDGLPSALHAETCFSGMPLNIGYTDMPYAAAGTIPDIRLKVSTLPTHVVTGAYRAPCFNTHAFMVETFIDECAVEAGIDPLEYRLRLLADWDRAWARCLQVTAEKINWGTPLAVGEGRGIAISNWPASGQPQAGATVCTAVQVHVSPEGQLAIQRIETSFDCGRVANRDAVEAQIQGGVIFGLNMTLLEGLTLRDGAVVEQNFDSLPMLRMADMPPVNVHFDALSGHHRFAIIGEAPVGSVGPALGNAIFQATGKRLRDTPFRHADLRRS